MKLRLWVATCSPLVQQAHRQAIQQRRLLHRRQIDFERRVFVDRRQQRGLVTRFS